MPRITVLREGKPVVVRVSNKFMDRCHKEAMKSPLEFAKWMEDIPEEKKTLLEEYSIACAKGFNEIDQAQLDRVSKQLKKEGQEIFGNESGDGTVAIMKTKDEEGNWKTNEVIPIK